MADTDVDHDKSEDLICSNKIGSARRYDCEREKLGTICSFITDMRSGQADYASLSLAGLFALKTDRYRNPWDLLAYESDEGGYVVSADKDGLEKAPRYAPSRDQHYDRALGEQAYHYYWLDYPTA